MPYPTEKQGIIWILLALFHWKLCLFPAEYIFWTHGVGKSWEKKTNRLSIFIYFFCSKQLIESSINIGLSNFFMRSK